MKCSARDDDLTSRDAPALAAARDRYRDGALALELDALDEALRQDVEVLPEPRRTIEIGQSSGDTVAINIVLWKREAPIAELGMAIIEIGDSPLCKSVAESEGESAPIAWEGAMDRDWPLLAMVGAIEIKIALELAQEGQAIPIG